MDWFNVLTHFENKNYVYNGLTLPFLIGVHTILEPHSPLLSIEEFIHAASNSCPPVTLMKCGNIGEYVFGTLDGETEAICKQYPNLYKKFENIIVTDNSFSNCQDIDEIIIILKDENQKRIDAKQFSKVSGEWGNYTKQDIERVKELLKEN